MFGNLMIFNITYIINYFYFDITMHRKILTSYTSTQIYPQLPFKQIIFGIIKLQTIGTVITVSLFRPLIKQRATRRLTD